MIALAVALVPSIPCPARTLTPDEAEAAGVEAFADLDRRKREAVLERCVEAALATGAPQVALVEEWAGRFEGKRSRMPEPTEFEAHSAKEFKGGSKRRLVERDDKDYDDSRRPPVEEIPRPRWVREVVYEFPTGRIVQREIDRKDETWQLRNLLEGFLPGQDLAHAVVLARLDEGTPFQKEAEYFEHLYCDRDQRAYEGITLFDAWSSPGFEMEMPDVEVRAYAIKIWDDESLPVPLSDREHDEWYPRIEESYLAYKAHRLMCEALAATWFDGQPVLEGGYDNSINILHALIALEAQDPAAVAERLQRDGDRTLHVALEEVEEAGNDAWNAGNARRDGLSEGRAAIRSAVRDVLREEGLLAE